MFRRTGEIVLGHVAIAVRFLGSTVVSLAAGEDEPRELLAHSDLEEIDHAEDVHARAKMRVGLDFRAHQIGEMNRVRDVGMLL